MEVIGRMLVRQLVQDLGPCLPVPANRAQTSRKGTRRALAHAARGCDMLLLLLQGHLLLAAVAELHYAPCHYSQGVAVGHVLRLS